MPKISILRTFPAEILGSMDPPRSLPSPLARRVIFRQPPLSVANKLCLNPLTRGSMMTTVSNAMETYLNRGRIDPCVRAAMPECAGTPEVDLGAAETLELCASKCRAKGNCRSAGGGVLPV